MNDKTLFILTPGFPKDEQDSTCLPSQQLFVLTAKKLFPDLRVIVVSLQYPAGKFNYNWNGIEVHALNGKRYKGLRRFLFWIDSYKTLLTISNQINVIGVLSFWCNETALIGKYFAKRLGVPHKIWISGQDARKTNRFVKFIKPKPEELVAMSDFLRDEFSKNHNVIPSHIITNAVQPSWQNVVKEIDIIGAGSLIPLKQYHLFVEIVAEVSKSCPGVKAVLFGKGPEENSLRRKIAKLGMSDIIALYNEVDHQTLMRLMNRSKVLVHPSSYEGYSTVCLEALANGCHVVSFTYAENKKVPHWKVVADKNQMVDTVAQILKNETDFLPVIKREIEITVKSMISLFLQK